MWQAVKESVSPKKLSTTKTFRGIINAADQLPPTPKGDAEGKQARKKASEARFSIAPEELLQGRKPSVSYDTKKKDLKPGQLDGLDRKRGERLRKGKLDIEGTLDLHGMTLDRAHPALNRFILGAHHQGKRLVLVITGKGKARDEGGPIHTL